MVDTKFQNEERYSKPPLPRIYPPTVQPLLQSLLATLADIDFDYEQERQKVCNNSPDTNLKVRALAKLKSRHYERRQPYIQQLAILQKQIMELKA
ncbi:hypothetical protein [Microvirga sp. Mcv34]|uniref:hypothetical protein n=1 Tax=Microvirga sp. Mcv34 TaxID=2926016 RepID=UPI0021C8A775|nr:hypothetical protein [Microvirga sp. Mcv34]